MQVILRFILIVFHLTLAKNYTTLNEKMGDFGLKTKEKGDSD